MDPQSIKKFLVPAVAVAALILIIALIVGNSGAPPKTASSANPKDRGPIVKDGADTSPAGMVDAMPTESHWTVLAGGLKYKDVKEGTGETISPGRPPTPTTPAGSPSTGSSSTAAAKVASRSNFNSAAAPAASSKAGSAASPA